MNKILNKDKLLMLIGGVFIYVLFYYISKQTPLAGDDWGYAFNGLNDNIFRTISHFYTNWSGRVFSEFYSLTVIPQKWLWNLLNPLLFLFIYYMLIKIINKKSYVIYVGVLMFMLSVSNHMRMQTYTWLTGTGFYTIALLSLLVYLYIIKSVLLHKKQFNLYRILIAILCNVQISMSMENAAIILVLLNISVLVYAYIYKKEYFKIFFLIFIFNLVAFAILFFAPGSSQRLLRDHADWVSLSVFEKISINWKHFMYYTFLSSPILFSFFNTVSLMHIFTSWKQNKYVKSIMALIIMMSFLFIFAEKLHISWLVDMKDIRIVIFLTVYYFIYVISIFYIFYHVLKRTLFIEVSVYIVLAGVSNAVMMMSPIFAARSSLYTYYLLVLVVLLLMNELKGKIIYPIFVVISIGIIGIKTINYIKIYQTVSHFHHMRMQQIQYYQDNPNEKEAWLVRMPSELIHSYDIELNDTYHQEVFKKYFKLNPEMKLIFYNHKK